MSHNQTDLLYAILGGYDKHVRPNFGGPPVTVGVSMYVLSVSSLSEQDMDFTLTAYFRQFWHDPRLAFERRPGMDRLRYAGDYVSGQLWSPDTFFANEKAEAGGNRQFSSSTTNELVRISADGEVLKSARISLRASCPMYLGHFPMDSQLCYLEMESFGHTMSDIQYRWNDGDNSVQVSPDVSLPQFKFLGHRQKVIEGSLSTGNYSRLSVEFLFERSILSRYYAFQLYFPCALMVVISWSSFWLGSAANNARVTIGTLTTFSFFCIMTFNSPLPKVKVVTASDIYVGACLIMTVLALFETVLTGFLSTFGDGGLTAAAANSGGEHEKSATSAAAAVAAAASSTADKVSRFLFPCLFIGFNVAYWTTFSKIAATPQLDDLI